MNHPKNNKSSFDDEDMKSLLDPSQVNVPDGLDDSILAAARAAVESDQNQVAPEKSHAASVTAADKKWWGQSWGAGLSVAAVVVLAVVLTPLILSSPESALPDMASLELESAPIAEPATTDASSVNESSYAVSAEDAVSQPRELNNSKAEQRDEINKNQTAVDAVANAESAREAASTIAVAPTPRSAAIQTDVAASPVLMPDGQADQEAEPDAGVQPGLARERMDKEEVSDSALGQSQAKVTVPLVKSADDLPRENDERSSIVLTNVGEETLELEESRIELPVFPTIKTPAENEPAYRLKPDSWIKEILERLESKDLVKAREEIALFKERHPDHELLKSLPEEL